MNVQYYRPLGDQNDNTQKQVVQKSEDSNSHIVQKSEDSDSDTNNVERVIERKEGTTPEQMVKSYFINEMQLIVLDFVNKIYISFLFFIKKIWFLCFALCCVHLGAYGSKHQLHLSRFS